MAQNNERPKTLLASGNVGGYADSRCNIAGISVTASETSGGGFILYDDDGPNPAASTEVLRVMVGIGRTSNQYKVGRLATRGYVKFVNSPLSVNLVLR